MNKASRPQRIIGFCVVLLGCLFFAVRGYYDQTLALQSFDFKPVYSGARCLIDGCDPYDSIQIEHAFLRHGGDRSDLRPFRPFNANYLPSALFLVIPLALLPFGPAHLLWLAISAVLFSVAALCMADLCLGPRALFVQCILAAFAASSTLLMMLGQPAMISIALTVIAVWCFLKQRFTVVGVLAFAISLTFKPHMGALIWLFFLLAARGAREPKRAAQEASTEPASKFRLRALQTLAVTVILMAPGILLAFHHPASAHWPEELHTNLVGIAAHGSASDPGPANREAPGIASLQALFSLIHDTPRFYDRASLAVFTPLFLAWIYLIMRPVGSAGRRLYAEAGRSATFSRDVLALATVAALTFLPIYHRVYDTRMLLLMFPAIAVLASTDRLAGKAALAAGILSTITLSHQFGGLGARFFHGRIGLPPAFWLVFYRPAPLTLLLLSCFFLYCTFRLAFEERRA